VPALHCPVGDSNHTLPVLDIWTIKDDLPLRIQSQSYVPRCPDYSLAGEVRCRMATFQLRWKCVIYPEMFVTGQQVGCTSLITHIFLPKQRSLISLMSGTYIRATDPSGSRSSFALMLAINQVAVINREGSSHWMISLMSIFEIHEHSHETCVEWPMSL
jgi:hypothetical protein